MKRKLSIFLIFIASLFCITSCASNRTHQHKTSDEYKYEKDYHYQVCEECGEILNKEDHSFEITEHEATCTEDGTVEYSCTVCGYSYTVTKSNALGHKLVRAVKEVSCTEDGYSYAYCERCNHTEIYEATRVPATGHNYHMETVTLTCTRDSYTAKTCLTCGYSIVEDFEYSQGHLLSKVVRVKEPTCTEAGIETLYCENCDYYESRTIPMLYHEYEAEQLSQNEIAYVCKYCKDYYVDSTAMAVLYKDNVTEIYNADPEITFTIETEDELLFDSILLCDLNLLGTDYENNEELKTKYSITPRDGVYTISAENGFEAGITYTLEVPSGVTFKDYDTNVIHFTIKKDQTSVIKGKDDVKFIKQMDEENPGYLPEDATNLSDIVSFPKSEGEDIYQSEYFYAILGKVDGLEIGDIICISLDIQNFDQVKENLTSNYYYGEIYNIYPNEGKYLLILTCPNMSDIYDELDILYSEDIQIEKYKENIDEEEVTEQVKAAFIQDEEFQTFLLSARAEAEDYALMNNYDINCSDEALLSNSLTIEPKVTIEGAKVTAGISGKVEIDINSKSGKKIGTFSVSFTAEISAEFKLNINYELKYTWFIPTGIEYFDFSITETNVFDFKFEVKIDISWKLTEDEEDDAKIFALNTVADNGTTNRLHLKNCFYIKKIMKDDTKSKLLYWTIDEYLANKDTVEHYCENCKPLELLDQSYYILNTSEHKIHCWSTACTYVKMMNASNAVQTDKSISELEKEGYSVCEYCEARINILKQLTPEQKLTLRMVQSDWSEELTSLREYAIQSGADKYKGDGITLCKVPFELPPFVVGFDLRLTMSFELHASLLYEYKVEQVNVFGIRKENGKMTSYQSFSKPTVTKNELTISGKMEYKVGLQVDAYISFCGLSEFVRAGIKAEVGLYIDVNGIYHKDFLDGEFYAAAYLEIGLYGEISAYYKLFTLSDSMTIYSGKLPLYRLGYEKAYFNYDIESDELEIYMDNEESYTIPEDFLPVEYYNLLKMEESSEHLSIEGNSLYTVSYTFAASESYLSYQNGVIYASAETPADYTAEMYITVASQTQWNEFISGSSVFYLPTLVVSVHFKYDKDTSHHILTTEGSYKATCTETGLDKVWCSRCNEVFKKEILPATGHYIVDGECQLCHLSQTVLLAGNEYLVTFIVNGGDMNGVNSYIVKYQEAYGDIPKATKTGYSFAGWYLDKELTKSVTSDTIVEIAGNHVLYAKYNECNYIVSFITNIDELTLPDITMKYGEAYNLNDLEKNGYEFIGWYLDNGERIYNGQSLTTAKNHTLTARFKAFETTVILNTCGGTLADEESTITVSYNSIYGYLPEPVYTGHKFQGWFTEENEGVEITLETINTSLDKIIILYAHWDEEVYNVTLKNGESQSTISVSFNHTYDELSDLQKDGYTFLGWYTDDGTQITSTTICTIAEDHTLTAKFKINTYKISFNTPELETAIETIEVSYLSKYQLPVPEREGYVFMGWVTSSGEEFSSNSYYSRIFDVELHAVWEKSNS